MRNWNLDLTIKGVLLAALVLIPATAHAQRPGTGSIVTVVARVPSIIRMAFEETRQNPDGSPVVRVITNDPTIRRRLASGVPAELVQRRAGLESSIRHAKGAEEAFAIEAGGPLLRYTVVAP